MTAIGTNTCHNFGTRADCLREPDAAFEMRFDVLGEPPLLWCRQCGPEALEARKMIEKALAGDPSLAKTLDAEVQKVHERIKAGAS